MQSALNIAERWCKLNELSINPAKAELVPFTMKRKTIITKMPILFNETQTLKEVEYLGVTLDSKLSWITHVDNKINSGHKILNQCRRMVGKQWGIKPKVMFWFYTMVVRSSLTYASLVWWPRTELHTIQIELQKFQRTVDLAITGCMRTTPSAALEIILGTQPLHVFIKQEGAMSALRIQSSNQWRNNQGRHTKILDYYAKECPSI